MAGDQHIRVECQDCPFSATVGPDDDRTAAELLVEHGRETDHQLLVTSVAETD